MTRPLGPEAIGAAGQALRQVGVQLAGLHTLLIGHGPNNPVNADAVAVLVHGIGAQIAPVCEVLRSLEDAAQSEDMRVGVREAASRRWLAACERAKRQLREAGTTYKQFEQRHGLPKGIVAFGLNYGRLPPRNANFRRAALLLGITPDELNVPPEGARS